MKTTKERAADLFEGADVILDELSKTPGEHEVCAQYVQEVKAVYEKDDFTVSASNATALYGIRTIVDGRLGFATTNADRPETLRASAREAGEVAKVAIPTPDRHVATGIGEVAHEELCDPGLLSLSPDDLYALLGLLIDEARKDSRVALDRCELQWTVGTDVLANSEGARVSAARACCSWMAMGMARTGEEVSSFDYDGSESAVRDGLEDRIRKSAVDFRESVIGSLGATGARTYRGKVLLHPYVVHGLLAQAVAGNCDGQFHVEGVSPWKGKVGEQVASEMLTVYEDPGDAEMAGWSPFDREGRPTARHVLVDKGRLAFVGYDGYYAARAGTEPTGNARGGASSLPTTGFSNLVVTAEGTRVMSEEALAKELGTGLVVKRFSGNDDFFSGQFSGTAKNSWWVNDGQRSHAVNEVMIAGNLFEALKQVVAAGDTLHSLFAQGRAPYLLIDGISVTAG